MPDKCQKLLGDQDENYDEEIDSIPNQFTTYDFGNTRLREPL